MSTLSQTRFGRRFDMILDQLQCYLKLDLSDYAESMEIPLLSLLNHQLGHASPTFFFGNTILPPGNAPKFFKQLPHFFAVIFHRPKKTLFHATAMELPFEWDAGRLLDPLAAKPLANGVQCTFYKLHGFVTQAQGKYVTYTRTRGGQQWYRCCDENITKIELNIRVSSKGVLMAIYRLQDK